MDAFQKTVEVSQDAGPSLPPNPPVPSPKPPSRDSRSPLTLVIVAFAVALMLYVGFHAARRNPCPLAGLLQSKVAPHFSLQSPGRTTVRLSDLRGKAVL